MRLKSPRKGKIKKQYRRKFPDSKAVWIGVRYNFRWRTRDESCRYQSRDASGKLRYHSTPQEAMKYLEEGQVNGKVPSCPGVYFRKPGEWAIVDWVDFEPTVVSIGDLEDALEYFAETQGFSE